MPGAAGFRPSTKNALVERSCIAWRFPLSNAQMAAGEGRAYANVLIQTALVGEAVSDGGYAFLVADEEMRYLAVSDGACALLGYSREELLDLRVPDVVVETDAASLYSEFLRERSQQGLITLRRKDGEEIVATYDARAARVGGLPYYVSLLTPLDISLRVARALSRSADLWESSEALQAQAAQQQKRARKNLRSRDS